MSHLNVRAWKPLNLQEYRHAHLPEYVAPCYLVFPENPLYILRMLIRSQNEDQYSAPDNLFFLKPFIDACIAYQKKYVRVRHPFLYLTVRHGPVVSETDDEWHVDGFSMKYNHLPEQSYIWANHSPTQFGTVELDIKGFNPAKHNIHKLIQRHNPLPAVGSRPNAIYCIDPYIIHRRPPNLNKDAWRSFVRVTFSPIEIRDVNNTLNPFVVSNNDFDGVKQFRDKLL